MEGFILRHKSDNQGSQSWLNETRNSIGGSSVAYFTGKGYGSLEEFIVNRVFKKEYSNIAMNFGSIMEDVLPKYLNLKYGIENYSLGAVPYLIENEKPSYKEPPKEVCFYAYKRINHFKEIIAQFQGKETTQIPYDVIEILNNKLKKREFKCVKLQIKKRKKY